jgi:hypothetical protein
LRPEEVEPWTPKLLAAAEPLGVTTPGFDLNAPVTEKDSQAFFDALLPVFREMAQAVFTPERLQSLVSQLKQYRNQLFDSGERKPSSWAQGAILYLEREDQPGLNPFLIALCFQSLNTLRPDPG